MKIRLDYKPWKITVAPPYRRSTDQKPGVIPIRSGPGIESVGSEIFHKIKSWRRFPVSFGDAGGPDAETVFVLLDRLQTPMALLDPKYSTIAKAEKIRPSELPKALRDLFNHLVLLGHAKAEIETDTEPEGKRA